MGIKGTETKGDGHRAAIADGAIQYVRLCRGCAVVWYILCQSHRSRQLPWSLGADPSRNVDSYLDVRQCTFSSGLAFMKVLVS